MRPRTRTCRLFSLGHAAGLMTVGAMLVRFVPHVTASSAWSADGDAADGVLVIGMVAAGRLGDRSDKRAIIIAAMFLHRQDYGFSS